MNHRADWLCSVRGGSRVACAVLVLVMLIPSLMARAGAPLPLPFVKEARMGAQVCSLATVKIDGEPALANEAGILRELLAERGIKEGAAGTRILLRVGEVSASVRKSDYQPRIAEQAYRLAIGKEEVVIQSPTPEAVLYGVQTLMQLVTFDSTVQEGEITDWPDLPVRAIMLDLARANENEAYYSRVIRFCAHYKINRLHLHLTDDENACLYHEKYPWLMHPDAWRKDAMGKLVALAARYHIDVVPEIESLGHARLFLRHPNFRDILHQTTDLKPKKSWAGTSVEGYTNVLCPASEETYVYLGDMFALAAEVFPYPETHIGGDEVDETECARCQARFPGMSYADWYLTHVQRCLGIIEKEGRRMGLWGDVLLKHEEIVPKIPRDEVVIYDWHYRPDMSDESVIFFKKHGFDILGCPALVCHPHMIMPSDYNYDNIRRFAEIARGHDLLGLDTTVWTPIRYMSDVLWPGIAFAAVQSWGGSNWDEASFYDAFARDFFGLEKGEAFAKAWTELYHIRWWLDRFKVSCWADDAGLAEAAEKAAGEWGSEARQDLQRLADIKKTLHAIGANVRRNREAWLAVEHSADILDFVLTHFIASVDVRRNGEVDLALLEALDTRCVEALGWVEADWNRNRFADDPYKADINNTGQHLLAHLQRMHAYHVTLIQTATEGSR